MSDIQGEPMPAMFPGTVQPSTTIEGEIVTDEKLDDIVTVQGASPVDEMEGANRKWFHEVCQGPVYLSRADTLIFRNAIVLRQ